MNEANEANKVNKVNEANKMNAIKDIEIYTNVPMHLIRGGLRPIGIAKGIQITSTNIFTDISGFFAGLVGSKNDSTITKHYLEAYDAAIKKMKLDALRINKNCKYLATVKIDVSELSKGGNSQGYIVIAAYGTIYCPSSNKEDCDGCWFMNSCRPCTKNPNGSKIRCEKNKGEWMKSDSENCNNTQQPQKQNTDKTAKIYSEQPKQPNLINQSGGTNNKRYTRRKLDNNNNHSMKTTRRIK